jgi:hypothetical protein
VDLHTLRHSYGNNKIRQGWGLKKVSLILGHSDISMTANVYTHLLDGDLKVRDDFRFDEERRKELQEDQSAERMASLLSEFVQTLARTGTVAEKDLESCLAKAIKQVDQPAIDQPGSREICRYSRKQGRTPPRATLVLHKSENGLLKTKEPGSFESQALVIASEKMACPKGIEPSTFSSGG